MADFEVGDLVVALEGVYKDKAGYVATLQLGTGDQEDYYQVMFEKDGFAVLDTVAESTLAPAEVEGDGPELEETPSFGMSHDELAGHTKYLLTKAMDRITEVKQEDWAFGFLQFEGMDAREILVLLLNKIEDSMALSAQAHILVSRTIIGLQLLEDS